MSPFFVAAAVLLLACAGNAAFSATVTRAVVHKSKREMLLFSGDRLLKSYRIALGRNPIGPKQQQGDGKTPEGKYVISGRNPKSLFHLSLRISYPSREDSQRARRMGVSPGGDIMIHGLPNRVEKLEGLGLADDWTEGCIAVTNEEIRELWNLLPNGTPIEILP